MSGVSFRERALTGGPNRKKDRYGVRTIFNPCLLQIFPFLAFLISYYFTYFSRVLDQIYQIIVNSILGLFTCFVLMCFYSPKYSG